MRQLILIALISPLYLFAQPQKIDSLKLILKSNPKNVETLSAIGLEYSKNNKDSFKFYANYANQLAKTDCEKSYSLNAIGGYLITNSKIDSAIFSYKEAIENAKKCGNKQQQAQILINLSFVYILKGENDTTIELTTNAIKILETIKLNEAIQLLICKALKYKGDAYSRLGQYDKATENLFEAKKQNNNSNLDMEASINGSLGSLYTNKLELDKAITYTKLSAEKFEKLNNIVNAEMQFSNLANEYIEYKKYDSAAYYLKKCEPLLQHINNPTKQAYVNKSWARLFLAKKNLGQALVYYDKAISNYTEAGEDVLLADCFYGKAETYAKQNNYTLAKIFFLKTETLYIENEMPNELSGLYYDLAKLESKKGAYNNAYNYLSKSYDIEDSLRSEKIIEAEKNAEQKYEASLKEATITKQNVEIKTQKQKNFWLITGSVIAALVAFILGLLYKRIRGQKKQIEVQKQEILHNNRNNIQQLISIFNRQSETEGLKENSLANQERLYTLNLLNKLLYESGENNKADIKEYLTQLSSAKEIGSGKLVKIKLDTPNIKLKSNLLKDIGLIVNELTTNAIKYAFKNNENPLIAIKVNYDDAQNINLHIADNGNGLPEGFNLLQERKSFGLEFVNDLVTQHHGTIKAYNNNGTCFDISLKVR